MEYLIRSIASERLYLKHFNRLNTCLYMHLCKICFYLWLAYICVTHYIGFPFGSASFTELLCWCGTVFSALPHAVYSQEVCRPSWLLRSSSGGKLLVPRVNTSTMQRRAFSVAALSIWNSLPSQI